MRSWQSNFEDVKEKSVKVGKKPSEEYSFESNLRRSLKPKGE